MSIATIAGVGLAATGAAHFVAPDAFRAMTEGPFPDDTDAWIKRNGATELVVGLLIAKQSTRKIGLVGLAAYAGFLGSRAAKAR
ncbi:hypothetical protein [Actinospongicola halichondriae]|uniref:hypothetical protein n=1 Tax=Actinospongicola halichondriae TaxID=3236844 RepID=UPI003D4645F5